MLTRLEGLHAADLTRRGDGEFKSRSRSRSGSRSRSRSRSKSACCSRWVLQKRSGPRRSSPVRSGPVRSGLRSEIGPVPRSEEHSKLLVSVTYCSASLHWLHPPLHIRKVKVGRESRAFLILIAKIRKSCRKIRVWSSEK